jgi:hypothetical protein
MRTRIAFLLLALFLAGCNKGDPQFPGYKAGSGDAAVFVLSSAVAFGARAVSTNAPPKLEAEWRYKTDKDGVQIFLIGDHFAQIQSVLLAAFGPPAISPKTNQDGNVSMGVYASPAIGAAIQFQREKKSNGSIYTQVLIVRGGAIKP